MKKQTILIQQNAERLSPAAEMLGKIAARSFTNNKSQLKNLEGITLTTNNPAEVISYIKRQTARKNKEWEKLGPKLIEHLQSNQNDSISKITDEITAKVGITDRYEILQIRLGLMREMISQMIVNFEYHGAVNHG